MSYTLTEGHCLALLLTMFCLPMFEVTVTPGLLEYSSGDTLDYVEPCLPCASVSVET